MTQLTSAGLIKVLVQVTLIMSTILFSSVAGIVVDRILGTSPLFVLGGLALGTAVAAIGIWLYVRAQLRTMARPQRSEETPDRR